MNNEIIKKTYDFVLNHSKSDDIHGFSHTKRVYDLCIKLGIALNANLPILKIASLLHDIGRKYEDSEYKNHAELSAKIATDFLNNNSALSKDKIDSIVHCIRAHSYSNSVKPISLEAKILSDADKLDALGAIGLYRTIGFTVKNNGNLQDVINHLNNKIFKLKDILFLDLSKEIAQKRLEILYLFYEEIKKEI